MTETVFPELDNIEPVAINISSPFMLARIRRTVSEHYRIPEVHLTCDRRARPYIAPRFAYCWLANKLSGASMKRIGDSLGGRDHTTIIHAVKRAEEMRETDPGFAASLDALAAKLEDK